MKPDRVFLQDLKTLDPRLDVMWNRDIERFVITFKRATGTPVSLFVVKRDEDGGFRQPDNRDILFLKRHDLSRTSLNAYLNEISSYMEGYREKKRKESAENFRDMTKDDKIQLAKALARPTSPKSGQGTFAKINRKPKNAVKVIDHRFTALNSEKEKPNVSNSV